MLMFIIPIKGQTKHTVRERGEVHPPAAHTHIERVTSHYFRCIWKCHLLNFFPRHCQVVQNRNSDRSFMWQHEQKNRTVGYALIHSINIIPFESQRSLLSSIGKESRLLLLMSAEYFFIFFLSHFVSFIMYA